MESLPLSESPIADHLSEGALAPDFELSDVSGRPFHLATALEAGAVALAFFKISCPTCDLTFPYIQRIWAAYGSSSPQIWGVSQDSKLETQQFAVELGLNFPILIDEHPFGVSDAYAVRYVPTIYLIDREQRIRIADCGFSKPALRALAREYADAGPIALFGPDDGRPERRPGCAANN